MVRLLQNALMDICEFLHRRQIDFALVGGIAASLRGRMRTTDDIDLVLMTDVNGALKLAREIDATPFQPLFPEFEKVVRTAYILALEHQPTRVTLDLAIGASGFEQQIVSRAQLVNIAGIIAVQRDAIDWTYCESVAGQLEQAMQMDLVKVVRRLQER